MSEEEKSRILNIIKEEFIKKYNAELAALEDTTKSAQTDSIDEEITATLTGVSGIIETTEEVKEDPEFNKILERIENAKTPEEVQDIYSDGLLMILNDSDLNANLLEETRKTKLEELNTDLSEQNLKVKDYLISKNPIFGTEENEIVVIKKVGDGKVTVKQIGVKKPRQKTFTEAQIKENFIKTTEEALNKQEMVEPVTDTQKTKATISKSSITEFSTNPELINKAKEDAASNDSASRLNALKNASSKNNINKCD